MDNLNVNKQVVYVKPNPKGWCLTYSYSSDYANQPGWYQVMIDESHLYGFALQPFTVRYDFKDHVLRYPGNWPTDPSDKIKGLQDQIDDLQDGNGNLKDQLASANQRNADRSKILLTLQQEVASLQGTKGSAKND